MTNIIKAAAAATLLVFGATTVMAQTTEKKEPPAATSGAVKDEKPTDPNTPKDQSAIKKLEKDQKGKSTQ